MHLHDKFYRPLPGTAVRSCCPGLLPLHWGWNRRCSGHLPPQTPAGLSKQQGWLPLRSAGGGIVAFCHFSFLITLWFHWIFPSFLMPFCTCALLSESYEEFKRNIHNLFPVIIDTKTVTKYVQKVRCRFFFVWTSNLCFTQERGYLSSVPCDNNRTATSSQCCLWKF